VELFTILYWWDKPFASAEKEIPGIITERESRSFAIIRFFEGMQNIDSGIITHE
jgi:hypothetical protein